MGRIYFLLYNNENKLEIARLADQYFSRAAELGSNSIYPIAARILIAYKTRVAPAPGLVQMAARRLEFGRPWEANMGALNNLVNCQMTQYCRLADDEITTLLLAALGNPDASRKMKGTAHSLLGGYYAVKLDKIELGMPHIIAAVKAEPERIEYRLDLIRLYGALGDLIAAKSELETVRKLDTWGLHRERVDAENALLDAARRANPN